MRTPRQQFEIRRNRVRTRISKDSDRARLSVFKSGRHIYAQVIDDVKGLTIVSASTLENDIRANKKSNCNVEKATRVGELLGDRATKAGIKKVVFDKGGYKYHGVIKALADASRKSLEF
jgi:large subunit ribosomal protein L18